MTFLCTRFGVKSFDYIVGRTVTKGAAKGSKICYWAINTVVHKCIQCTCVTMVIRDDDLLSGEEL